MKKIALPIIILSMALPHLAFAAWYNPLTWFNSWTFSGYHQEKSLQTDESIDSEVFSPTAVKEIKPVPKPTPIPKPSLAPTENSSPIPVKVPVTISVKPIDQEVVPLTEPNTVPGSGNLQIQLFKKYNCATTCPYYGAPMYLREADTMKDVANSVSNQNGLAIFKNLKPGKYRVTATGSNTFSGYVDVTVSANLLTKGKIFFHSYITDLPVPQTININSPKTGDKWKVGSKQFVRWDPGIIPKDYMIGIGLHGQWNGAGFSGQLYSSTNDGVEEILVPINAEPGHSYRISVGTFINNKLVSYQSPEFLIIAP